MTKDEAMRMALDALDEVEQTLKQISGFKFYPKYYETIEALRIALAQPKPEPMAWIHNFIDGGFTKSRPIGLDRHPDRWTPLYKDSTPCKTCESSHDTRKEWVGLTENDLSRIYNSANWDHDIDWSYERAIEAKLKEKNNG